jgi:hypothetical protein
MHPRLSKFIKENIPLERQDRAMEIWNEVGEESVMGWIEEAFTVGYHCALDEFHIERIKQEAARQGVEIALANVIRITRVIKAPRQYWWQFWREKPFEPDAQTPKGRIP